MPHEAMPELSSISLLMEKGEYLDVLVHSQALLELGHPSIELLVAVAVALHNTGQSDSAIETLGLIKQTDEFASASPHLQRLTRPISQTPMVIELEQAFSTCGGEILATFESPSHAPTLRVFTFHDMFLLGNYGLPVSESGFIIADAALNITREHALRTVELGLPKTQVPRLEGAYMPLFSRWSGNFFHWCTESLPKVIMAEKSGFSGTYLIPPDAPYAQDSLLALGISSSRCKIHRGNPIWIEALCLSSPLMGGNLGYYPSLLDDFRSTVFSHVSARKNSGRIYISRNRNSQKRRIVNEEELIKIISKYHFETIFAETLSFRDQVSNFLCAEALITPHGAGMVHSIFMTPGSLILEGFAPDYVNPCMTSVCDYLGHKYFMLPSILNEPNYPHGSDMYLPLGVIESTLKREFNGRN